MIGESSPFTGIASTVADTLEAMLERKDVDGYAFHHVGATAFRVMVTSGKASLMATHTFQTNTPTQHVHDVIKRMAAQVKYDGFDDGYVVL